MSYERVCTDLYENIANKQFYPFSVAQAHTHSCRKENSPKTLLSKDRSVYKAIVKDLGLSSCVVDTDNPLTSSNTSSGDLYDKTGVVLFFVSNCLCFNSISL